MSERAFPAYPTMHEENIRPGESDFDFASHSGSESAVRYRRLAEQWLQNYPKEHRESFLRRFQSSNNDSHRPAFFELFLHDYLRVQCEDIEIEGELVDSGKYADFILNYNDGTQLAVEALSLQQIEVVGDSMLSLLNHWISEVESLDFYIWLGDTQGNLASTPPKTLVQSWAASVLHTYSWEDANRITAATGSIKLEVEPLRFGTWSMQAHVVAKESNKRTSKTSLLKPAGSWSGVSALPSTVRDKALKKIAKKKRVRTDMPFVLAINVADYTSPAGEDELGVLYGFRHQVQFSIADCPDGAMIHDAKGFFSPDNHEGVWSTSRNEAQYERCDGIWFFHQVGPHYPRGRRQALYLNPYSDHGFPLRALQDFSISQFGWLDGT